MPARFALLLLAFALPMGTPTSAQEPGERLCGTCKTTGRIALDINKKFSMDHEHGETWKVLHCADAIESDDMAMDWKPCARCKTPSVQEKAIKQWEAIEAEKLAWLAERRKVDELIDAKGMAHVETTHFIISWNIPKVTTGDRKTYRMHEAAHLYARRMEELYAKFQEMFKVEDRQNMRNKHYWYVLEKEREALTVGPVYAGLGHGHREARRWRRPRVGGRHVAQQVGAPERRRLPPPLDPQRHPPVHIGLLRHPLVQDRGEGALAAVAERQVRLDRRGPGALVRDGLRRRGQHVLHP
jgi:hypothetical protein